MVTPDVTAVEQDGVTVLVDGPPSVLASDVEVDRAQLISWRGKPRRSWLQRLLVLSGLVVAAACFSGAWVFWQANVVLSEVPRIRVGPDVLAAAGDPGDPVNILLVGIDSSEGLDEDDPVREGREVEDEARGVVRPDTILIARLDPATGSGSVLSLPRDLIVELEGGSTTRLNATQTVGGIGSLISAIDDNLEIPINHFVMVDFAGFSDIVDLVGGVPVYFPYPTRDIPSGLSVPESGCFNLNGRESLSYVRARNIEELIENEWVDLFAASPDIARIERQQDFLVLTTEQILAVGRRDVSRISSFVSASTQAVQLDEELTPGDIADLAAAFSDFDTDALAVSTLPVAASFSEEGTYLGEQLIADEAVELLSFFRGLSSTLRPDDVSFTVQSDTERHGNELAERGFGVLSEDVDLAVRSTIQFDPNTDAGKAMLVARYLEAAPEFVAVVGADLTLEIGPDFAGVRLFPRAESDLAAALAAAANEGADLATDPEAVTTTQAPVTTIEPATSEVGETSVPGFAADDPDVLLSEEVSNEDNPVVTQEAQSPVSTVVRGRPPEGIGCTTIGG